MRVELVFQRDPHLFCLLGQILKNHWTNTLLYTDLDTENVEPSITINNKIIFLAMLDNKALYIGRVKVILAP